MPSDRLQTRLLPRASARLISLLLLWWFFLVNPLLFLWRGAAEASGSVFYGGGAGELVSEAPSGDWSFRVPMEIGAPPSPREPAEARGREGPFHRVRHAAAGRHRVHFRTAARIFRPEGSTPRNAAPPPSMIVSPSTSTLNSP